MFLTNVLTEKDVNNIDNAIKVVLVMNRLVLRFIKIASIPFAIMRHNPIEGMYRIRSVERK